MWFRYRWNCPTITENLRVWKWHMAVAFHFSPSTSTSILWNFTLPIYWIATKLSATKDGFPCTSGASPVNQSRTTRIHNREPKYRSFSFIYDILNSFANTHLHIEIVMSTTVDQVVACLSVTQRAWVHSSVGTSFLGEVFSGFFLTCKTHVRKL